MKKIILTLTKTLLTAGLVLSLGKIAIKSNAYVEADKTTKEVVSIKNSNTSEDANEKLSNKNDDFKFWISIDNTKINHPVVQGEDNEFYLNHDFNKSKNSAGSIFIDSRVNSDSKNVVVYGHNMKNGSMFADIELFKNKEFFDNNKFIVVEKDGIQYIYEVFSVYYLSGENTDYLQTNFSSCEEFANFIHLAKERSLFDSNKEISSENILTLSTCSYEGNNFRTAIHAQLVGTI